jgi:8-oxoguanine DNA-glycosylase Ogg
MARSVFAVQDYDLEATLDSGQAFRWRFAGGAWTGVIGNRWTRLHQEGGSIIAETPAPAADWQWLRSYLQMDTDLESVLATFPDDAPLRAAVAACRGLRLLRQDPWECLASFILSSTKQIIQIRQIVTLLCERYGERIQAPRGCAPAFAFPTAARVAEAGEAGLRACKAGFRAPYLVAAARAVASGEIDLERIGELPLGDARAKLLELPGVGVKIANCVLLFSSGFRQAFPVDVWVLKALVQLYFPRRRASPNQLRNFVDTHFGPNAGYAQQYLFHYMRTKHARPANPGKPSEGKTKPSIRSASRPAPAGGATLEALFTPADFAALERRQLDDTACVVFDVLRATSTMIAALSNGAAAVVPVAEISEALAVRARDPGVLLAGERDGVRIRAAQSGGTDFDLGNSPREFLREVVEGKIIVSTTTNGTRALRASARAATVLAGSFLNLRATADHLRAVGAANLIVVCSGTFEQAAYEDILAAGALCDLIWDVYGRGEVSDAARVARQIFLDARGDLMATMANSRNAQRLLAIPELRDDVAFCLRRDVIPLVAALGRDGRVAALP